MEIEMKSVGDKESLRFRKEWEKIDKEAGYEWTEKRKTLGIFLLDEMVGYVRIRINGGRLYLQEMMIREDLRKRGLGEQALAWLERFARKNGCHKMLLKTNSRLHMEELARKLGWEDEAVLYNDAFGLNWVYMSKKVK